LLSVRGADDANQGGFNMLKSRNQSIVRKDASSVSKSKAELLKDHEEVVAQEKRMLENERMRALEELHNKGDDAAAVIIMPKYVLDERLKVDREVNPPPAEVFMPLGWDEERTTNRKHYRQYYNDELENIAEIFPSASPFNSYSLKRGQTRGVSSGGLFGMFKAQKKDDSGQVSTE